jgi:hypothetical protein
MGVKDILFMAYSPSKVMINRRNVYPGIIRDSIHMTNKIVVLDIDGVFNVYPENEHNYLQGNKVRLLNTIALETNCRFIISSMWKRSFSLREITRRFVEKGLVNPNLIIGQTPDLGGYHPPRELEIYKWLSETSIEKWCVLDDKMLPKIPKERFFQTDFWKHGLTMDIVRNVITFLNK